MPMSRLFGELRQIGIVVRDVEAAMKHWIDVCGVGPWFYTDKLSVTEFSYRGARHDDIHLSIALANSGDVQLELIEQRCQTPSMYRDFLVAGREGMQHWSSWPVDYDDRLKRALSSGYLWNEGHPGTVIEMAHMTEGRQRIFDGVRTAAIGWDGSEPIRRTWPS
jgi:hypothetical protein